MTDIVERLRDNAPADHGLASGDLMREAAAEIERLRTERMDNDEHARLSADIFWLRAALEKIAAIKDDEHANGLNHAREIASKILVLIEEWEGE